MCSIKSRFAAQEERLKLCSHMQYQTHTHTHTYTHTAHDTHCSRAFCGTLVSVPTLQLLQVVQTRLERGGGGGGGPNREQRGRNEGGREKCVHILISRPACTGSCVSSTRSKK